MSAQQQASATVENLNTVLDCINSISDINDLRICAPKLIKALKQLKTQIPAAAALIQKGINYIEKAKNGEVSVKEMLQAAKILYNFMKSNTVQSLKKNVTALKNKFVALLNKPKKQAYQLSKRNRGAMKTARNRRMKKPVRR